MFSSPQPPTEDEKPKVTFKVIWNFPHKKKRTLILLPPLFIEAYTLFKRNQKLREYFNHTLQSICTAEQKYMVIAFPESYDEIDAYHLEELFDLEVRPLDSIHDLENEEFKQSLQPNILYHLPYDESWFQPKILSQYYDHVIQEAYISTPLEEILHEFETEKGDQSLIHGNQYVQEKLHQIRLQRTFVFSRLPMMKMVDLDLVFVIGYIPSDRIEWLDSILYHLAQKESIYTIYLCDGELEPLYDRIVEYELRVPNVYLKNYMPKQSVRLMWDTFENYNQSHTFLIFLGQFDVSKESQIIWREYAKDHLHHSIYDIYAYDSLELRRVKGEVLTTCYPFELLEKLGSLPSAQEEPEEED